MKLKGARLSILLPFVFCLTGFSHTHFQSNVIVLANPTSVVTGSIAAGRALNDCTLGETQYKIEIPGKPRKLFLDLTASQSVSIYVRRNFLVAIEDGKVVSDFKSFFPSTTQRLSLPGLGQGSDFDGIPVLEPGIYFIAVTNCGLAVADYTLSVKILEPPDAETVVLSPSLVEIGTVPAPVQGTCRLGRTQYSATASLAACGGATFWSVTIHADQKVNVYMRKGKRVTEENGIVMYDNVSSAQAKIHRTGFSPSRPGTETSFLAVENCGSDAVNYTVTAFLGIGDPSPPFISRVFLVKKDLHIVGAPIRGGKVFFGDKPQDSIDGGKDSNFNDVLIVKKAKKEIPRRQAVLIRVTGLACGSEAQFLFLRR